MNVKLVSWGWQHENWEQGVFYPEDLPTTQADDWRLSYFANEFDSVVIPASYWLAENINAEQLLADVHDEFEFIVDWPCDLHDQKIAYEKCLEFCQQAGKLLAAILINNQDWSLLSDIQQQALLQMSKSVSCQQYGDGEVIAGIDKVMVDDQRNSQLNKLSNIWLLSSASEELRDLGQRLQQGLKAAPIEKLVLLEKVPSIKRLQELKTILQLLA